MKFANPCTPELLASLRHLDAVVAAVLDQNGHIVDCNDGFRRLLGLYGDAQVDDAAWLFVAPRLDQLLISPKPSGQALHEGVLNLGRCDRTCHSLTGRIDRVGPHLILVAEYDVTEMERLNAWVMQSNEHLATTQRELARNQRQLQEALHALRQSEARYRAVVENQTEIICRFRSDGTILFVNEGYCRLFGKQTELLIGSQWAYPVHPDDLARVESLVRTLSPDQPVVLIENRVYSGDGQVHWMEFVTQAIFDTDGHIGEILSVGRDITKRKQLEIELTGLRRRLREMLDWQIVNQTLAALAHDLHQPLNAISFYSEAALRCQEQGPARSELLTKALDGITHEIGRASRVVRDILETSRMQPYPANEPFAIGEAIREIAYLAQASGYEDCRVQIDLVPGLPLVRSSRLAVEKVLWNVFCNGAEAAREAGRPEPCIAIAAAQEGNMIHVTVSDNGSGIDQTAAENIYDPFFTTKSHGLGMGLPISRALVEAQGGKLWHDSGSGCGATFHFSLPLQPGEAL